MFFAIFLEISNSLFEFSRKLKGERAKREFR
jgi:hypothetical protein